MRPGAARRSLPRFALAAFVAARFACPSDVARAAGEEDVAPLERSSGDAAELVRSRSDAVRLVRDRRCDAAIPALEDALRRDPGDARLALLAGECQIRLRRYPDALRSLETAKRIDPGLADVDLYLGITRYHLGDVVAAERDLESARETSPGRAEVDLYLGMVRLQRGEPAAAAEALERARRANPAAVEPVASYYEGLAWNAAGDPSRGREALLRVRDESPGTDWADAAARILEGGPGWGPRKSFGEMMVGTEWDTNVTLAGNDITPGDISGRRDLRTVWSALGGTEVYRGESYAVGALASYYGSAQTQLYQYDLQYPGASLWVDRRIDPDTTFRFQSEFNYAWYGYEPYVVLGGLNPQLFRSWGDWGLTWFYAKFYGGDYFFDAETDPNDLFTPGLDEGAARDRDGWGNTSGFLHTATIEPLDVEVRGGFNYYYYWSVGREWRYDAYEPLILGFTKPLVWDVVLDGQASFLYRTFENPSTYNSQGGLAGIDRRDNVWQFEVKLERPVTPWLVASARYYYLDHGSNTAAFNYRRQIWGGYLTVSFRQD